VREVAKMLDEPFNAQTVEGTCILNLNFGKLFSRGQEIIPVAVQNAATNEVILLAYTNEAAFKETIKKRKAIFWSTSRNSLWFKGEGNICHTAKNGIVNNCFYRKINFETLTLEFLNPVST
jgi:phosphoribosyl-AMP cyclohydrolase